MKQKTSFDYWTLSWQHHSVLIMAANILCSHVFVPVNTKLYRLALWIFINFVIYLQCFGSFKTSINGHHAVSWNVSSSEQIYCSRDKEARTIPQMFLLLFEMWKFWPSFLHLSSLIQDRGVAWIQTQMNLIWIVLKFTKFATTVGSYSHF